MQFRKKCRPHAPKSGVFHLFLRGVRRFPPFRAASRGRNGGRKRAARLAIGSASQGNVRRREGTVADFCVLCRLLPPSSAAGEGLVSRETHHFGHFRGAFRRKAGFTRHVSRRTPHSKDPRDGSAFGRGSPCIVSRGTGHFGRRWGVQWPKKRSPRCFTWNVAFCGKCRRTMFHVERSA